MRTSLRYVLIGDGEQDPSTPANHHGNPSGNSAALLPSSNPFAMARDDDTNTVITVRGATATSLVPAVTGDLFGAGGTREPGAGVRARTGNARNDPPLSPPPQLPPASPSPSPSPSPPSEDKAVATNLFQHGLRDRRSLGAAGGGGGTRRVSGDWIDSRASSGKAKRRGEPAVAKSGGFSLSSSAGGGWLEAAAAAEEAGAVAAGGADVKNASGLWLRGGSGSPPSGGSVVATSTLHGTAGRRVSTDGGPRKGSVSSADSSSVVSSPSMRADALGVGGSKAQQWQNQQRRKGGGGGSGGQTTSAMEAAAEVAAAKASARGHPDARRVEERMLAAQAMTDGAVTVLEQQLRPLITRKNPARSPRQSPSGYSPASSPPSADMRGGRRLAMSSPVSSFSSPRDSPRSRSPQSFSPKASGEEQQLRWAAAVPEGSATAPLVAAATLLMERAWSRRQDLVVSIRKLRERAVALAVAEASAGVGSPAVAASARTGGVGSSGGCGAVDVVPANTTVDVNGNSSVSRSQPSPSSAHPPIPGAQERKKTLAAAPADTGGSAGLSCCLDFERILGDEGEALPPDETASFMGVHGVAVTGSSALRDGFAVDKRKPFSDSSTVAERSFSGMDQQSGGSEFLPVTRRAESASRPAPDEWQAVFRDVLIAEERGRELVKGWEAAGGALKHTCEDLAFGEADRSFIGGGAAQ